ncbi:UDP-N-acetylglucosamine 2-epimerase (non-hydrolyzing) [Alicyclobacillus sp. SO9]|nr:UDP-N-acetylglucosamine 2-epimerase (non-hydrolyzing) [Alicyclobacillus sp. SO9]QQE80320.1 UDP-N-acetylglucosamine 2-epimerase (non-hydrolyzing) [Alicyclobacillus sp. SO9]
MRVMTILGTRPEIIRLSLVIKKLDALSEHILVHTGQNYNYYLNDIFFEQMEIRKPDLMITGKTHSFGQQLGSLMPRLEELIKEQQPERVLVLGDTNTALAATVIASRLGVPIFHMEAGNRCFDRSVPEELNRKMIDSIADLNLPYTSGSRENLLREGIDTNRISVSGNPIYEVLLHYADQIQRSDIHKRLQIENRNYMLMTAHRAENVDNPERLRNIFKAATMIAESTDMPVICSIHPRTKARLQEYGVRFNSNRIQTHTPFGFYDFIALEKHASLVLTDSGTVQEECCLFHVPAVTMRRTTERPETIACGSNTLGSVETESIVLAANLANSKSVNWKCPEGYEDTDVSSRVVNIVLGGQMYV